MFSLVRGGTSGARLAMCVALEGPTAEPVTLEPRRFQVHERKGAKTMSSAMTSQDMYRRGMMVALSSLIITFVATSTLAWAQGQVQVDGTVQWLTGQTLMIVSDTPGPNAYVIVGQALLPVPGPRPTVNVD